MSDRIVFDEPKIREMIDIMRRSAKELRSGGGEMRGVARMIDEGALMGEAGNTLAQGMQSSLSGSMDALADDLEKQAQYVENELEQLLAAARGLG